MESKINSYPDGNVKIMNPDWESKQMNPDGNPKTHKEIS